ncbi:MAG: glycosyltransferase [Campylobacteraceae bacterium]|jgi:GalNAc5-diNAcBac-PP-undecaprenol beta-1,3-glucosyltransferase|nr:glycosyltransferase [Campylobacteraceae bacterium]
MKKIETITVVITNHNRPKIILPVIESIIDQPLKNIGLDILIIDDASTKQIDPNDLKKYGKKVKLHRLNENVGLHGARNAGIKLAKGDFIIIADDDDPFIPNTLQKALDLMVSLDNYLKYPMLFFARTNGYIQKDYMLLNEEDFFKKALKGDFTPIINKKVFLENDFIYPEYESIRQISCEILLSYEIARKFGIPTWNHKIVILGDADTTTNRLTNPDNWLIKAKQFAKLQELEIEYMQKYGFDKKYIDYYNFKLKGLYIYMLLDNRKIEARKLLKEKIDCSFFVKFGLFIISYLPISIIYKFLKIYRKMKK